MLVLTFEVAGSPFAVAVRRVVEVVPRVPLRAVPHAPRDLAGLLHFRGMAVPVIDLGVRVAGIPCAERLNTRIILAESGHQEPGRPPALIGLIAERVDDVRAVDLTRPALATSGVGGESAYLGSVYQVDGRLIQLVEPERVLAAGPKALGGPADPPESPGAVVP